MHAPSVPFPPMDTAKEDVILTLSSQTTNATLHVQAESSTELMLHVFRNVQLVTFLTKQFANCQSKLAHQNNSTMLKTEFVPLALSHAQNANTLTDIVLLAPLDSHLIQTSVLKQTTADQESSNLPQEHAQHVQ